MNELLVIVPSRSRPESVEQMREVFYGHGTGMADLMFATDDDQEPYPYVPGVSYSRGPRLRMCGTLNAVAVKEAKRYKYIGFMGDDHRPRTYQWDRQVIDALEHNNVVYGNDLLQGENLPTAVFLRAEIVQKLGYMAPPSLIHLYLDNFWLELGRATSIKYLPNVIIEHMHPAVGKAEWTDSYREVNDQALYSTDEFAFRQYMETQFASDLEKLNGV